MSSPPQEDSPTWVSAAFLVGKPHIAFVPAIEKQHLCGAVPKCVLFVPEKSRMDVAVAENYLLFFFFCLFILFLRTE